MSRKGPPPFFCFRGDFGYNPPRYFSKIEIVVELQKAAAGVREDLKRRVWPI